MEKKETNSGKVRQTSKLRLSRNKLPLEDPNIATSLELATAENCPQWEKDCDNITKTVHRLSHSPKLPNDWSLYQLTTTQVEVTPTTYDPKGRTYNITYPTRGSSHPSFQSPPESSNRKRHQISLQKTKSSPVKKMCMKETLHPPCETPRDDGLLKNALKEVQEKVFQQEKEGNNSDWLQAFIKPDAYNMMNVIKMKNLLSSHKRDSVGNEKKERLKQKVISARCSLEDDTDAPSIVSMEEDFKILPEPLRLSDLQLPIPNKSGSREGSVPWTSHSSLASETNKKHTDESIKTSGSSYTSEAPPLVVPELRLKLRRSHSDLSSSTGSEFHRQYHSEEPAGVDSVPTFSVPENKSPPRSISPSFSVLSSNKASSQSHSIQENLAEERSQPDTVKTRSNHEPIEIGQVHSSSASSPSDDSSSLHSHKLSEQELVSEYLPNLVSKSLESVHHDRVPSSLHSVEELSPTQESIQDEEKEIIQKLITPISSMSSIPPALYPKNIHFLQVLIEDAEFQRKQHELLFKTQEDIFHGNYKAALTNLDLRFRGYMGPYNERALSNENIAKARIDEQYKETIAKIRDQRNEALSNWDKRIEVLVRERDQLKKLSKNKRNVIKLRSAETSPKKITPLRSSSMTSVVESSSSDSSVMTQTFDDKKRLEADKEKTTLFIRRKVEKEIIKRLNEEMRKEREKMERAIKSGRSHRDKSTSPLESVLETNTRDVACSVKESSCSISQHGTSSLHSVEEEARGTDLYNSESFESPESSETPRHPRMINQSRPTLAAKPFVAARFNNKSKVLIKVPLAPRLQLRSKRPCSSGSDESLLLSQNETPSEQSDYEVKISALKEQKRQRCAELNRLVRELKRAQKEHLKATEAALIKQIQVYDSYIEQTKKQLEEVSATMIVRPQIKHPRVSDRFLPRNSDILEQSSVIETTEPKQQENLTSDMDTNSIKSVSEASSTETTIQSSGKAHVTDQSFPKTEINPEHSDTNIQSGNSEITEVLSDVPTEASSAPETQISSNGSKVTRRTPDVLKSVLPDSADINDDSQWVDAEVFFSQLGQPKQTLSSSSKPDEDTASSSPSDTQNYQILTNILQNDSKADFVTEELIQTKEKIIAVNSSSSKEISSENEEKYISSNSVSPKEVSSENEEKYISPNSVSPNEISSENEEKYISSNSVSAKEVSSENDEKYISPNSVSPNEIPSENEEKYISPNSVSPKEIPSENEETYISPNSVSPKEIPSENEEKYISPNSVLPKEISSENEEKYISPNSVSLKEILSEIETNIISPNSILANEILSDNKENVISQNSLSPNEILLPIQNNPTEDDNKSEHLDVGSVVSIISQAPTCRTPKSPSSDCQSSVGYEPKSISQNSVLGSRLECDILPSDNDVSTSVANSDKSNISETGAINSSQSNELSILSDLNTISQCYSGDDGSISISNSHSDIDDYLESSKSGVIKVFVSNKNQANNDIETVVDDINVALNENVSNQNQDLKKDVAYESKVDTITDDILNNLLSECFTTKKDQNEPIPMGNTEICDTITANMDLTTKNEIAVDDFTRTVLNKFLQDATDCMLKINESKKITSKDDSKLPSGFEDNALAHNSSDLLDALALEGKGINSVGGKAHEEVAVLPVNKEVEVEFNDGHESEVFWFDEDLHPVSLQNQREAEELRLKQLQIEQEIKQLEQAQEAIPSYYYVREIPNKPPPPYTPPGHTSSQAKDVLDPVPTRQEDIESLVTMATQSLGAAWKRGDDLCNMQPSDQFSSKKVGNQVYKKFLFDLVKQIFIDITSNNNDEKDSPPWERTGCRMKRLVLPKLTEEAVSAFVLKKVRVLFGFEPNSIKENLIIQWSRKKRDRVDELLVRESQEEEQEWTDYTKCEVAVKNNVALSIFDSLLDETTIALTSAFQKKLNYDQQT